MREFGDYVFDYEDIRAIVFDFDGVLYSAPTFSSEYDEYLTKMVAELKHTPYKVAHELLTKSGYIGVPPAFRKRFFSAECFSLGLSYTRYLDYCSKNPFIPKKSPIRTLSPGLLKMLSERYLLFIVSNDSLNIVKKKMEILNIDLANFRNVYTPSGYNESAYEKMPRYHQIINNYLLDRSEFYVFATNYQDDLQPLVEETMQGLLVDVNDGSQTEWFLAKNFLNLDV